MPIISKFERTACATSLSRAKNLDQLHSSINHHRTKTNLSGMSGGVWSMSGGVNENRLISPELMHVSEAADALVLLMQRALLLLKMN